MIEISGLTIVIVCSIAFFSGFIKGAAVLGFALVAAPLLAILFDPRDVLVALALPALLMDVFLALTSRTSAPPARLIAPLMGAGLVGSVIGAVALHTVDKRVLGIGVGSAAVTFALLGRLTARWRGTLSDVGGDIAGSCVGFVAGLTGFFGPPVVTYLQHQRLPKQMLAATAARTFVCFGIVRLASMAGLGLLNRQRWVISAALILPGMAGFVLGNRARSRISEHYFTSLVQALIVSSGTLLVAQNLST